MESAELIDCFGKDFPSQFTFLFGSKQTNSAGKHGHLKKFFHVVAKRENEVVFEASPKDARYKIPVLPTKARRETALCV